MLAQLLPATIMLAITIAVCLFFLIPILFFPQKNPVVNFYWSGFWFFLILVSGISGLINTLALLDIQLYSLGNSLLIATVTSFVLFVVFGWFRLTAHAFFSIAKATKKSASERKSAGSRQSV